MKSGILGISVRVLAFPFCRPSFFHCRALFNFFRQNSAVLCQQLRPLLFPANSQYEMPPVRFYTRALGLLLSEQSIPFSFPFKWTGGDAVGHSRPPVASG